jgi:hypothetical protein
MDHYQDLARAHFAVRRLERIYGRKVVRQAYDAIRHRAGADPASDEALTIPPLPERGVRGR